MSEYARAAPGSVEPVYSERDLEAIRMRWETEAKERRMESQLAELAGQMKSLPEVIRSQARQVVLEVLIEQKRDSSRNRWTQWPIVANLFLLSAGTIYEVLYGGFHPLVH